MSNKKILLNIYLDDRIIKRLPWNFTELLFSGASYTYRGKKHIEQQKLIYEMLNNSQQIGEIADNILEVDRGRGYGHDKFRAEFIKFSEFLEQEKNLKTKKEYIVGDKFKESISALANKKFSRVYIEYIELNPTDLANFITDNQEFKIIMLKFFDTNYNFEGGVNELFNSLQGADAAIESAKKKRIDTYYRSTTNAIVSHLLKID